MGFQLPITVKELVDNIDAQKYFLPSIQREFVWKTEQITKLFDSLMKGFPIGSFLSWQVPPTDVEKYTFYHFIKKYDQRKPHNDVAVLKGSPEIQAILDGQQRMTSLYIGLKGSYAEKRKYYNEYPKKRLYINLLMPQNSLVNEDDLGLSYDFKFLTDDEAKIRDDNTFWFLVGDILSHKFDRSPISTMNKYLKSEGLSGTYADDILLELYDALRGSKNKPISFYLEKEHDQLNDVVNIFIRMNSGGTVLSRSDLLMSFATAQLHELRNFREDVNDFVETINNIGDTSKFAFDQDFVLKAFFVLCDEIKSISFKPSNFADKDNMPAIHNNWSALTSAIKSAVELIDSYGFSKTTIASNNAVIPIAHYIYRRSNVKLDVKNRDMMIHWFITASISRTFRSSTDTVLREFRRIINASTENFPLAEMLNADNYSAEGIINEIIATKYKDKTVLMALSILYPNVNLSTHKFHIDHIFPRSKFPSKQRNDNTVNSLANLQLLEGSQNQSKSDKFFDEWLAKEFPETAARNKYMDENCIPDIDLSFANFTEFITKREERVRQRLCENLKAWNITN